MSDHQHQLRRSLQDMFPPQHLAQYHRGPGSVCTLLSIRCRRQCCPSGDDQDDSCCPDCEVSSEPSSRASVIGLRQQLANSLRQHQAKPTGLCPIRRQIYDQLFDELIRQVTVGCVEQGQLLFELRNELKMSLAASRRLYQSGLEFGLRIALRTEHELDRLHNRSQKEQLEARNKLIQAQIEAKEEELEMRNKLEGVDRMLDYYKQQLNDKDQIIEQQRAMIRAINQEVVSNIKSPI